MDSLYPHANNGNTPEKKCTGPCGRTLPATPDFFYRKKTGKYGLQPECKLCRNNRMQEYSNRPEVRKRKQDWSKEYWKRPEVKHRLHERRGSTRLPKSNAVPLGYKRCYVCKTIFAATPENFHRNKGLKDGLHRECKSCACKNTREYFQRSDIKSRKQSYDKLRRGRPGYRERERTRYRAYRNRPEVQERYRAWERERYSRLRHRILEQQKSRNNRPEVQAKRRSYLSNWRKAYYSRPEIRESRRAHVRNRYARKRAALGTHTPIQIREQYDRQKGKCYYCQRIVEWGHHHVDHVIPLSRGGRNDISNLVITCPTCNLRKNDKLPHEWPEGGRLL